jgi:SOS response regulatory protein OraA/RecX
MEGPKSSKTFSQKNKMSESSKAYSYLVKLLTGRDYSEHKLKEKLQEKVRAKKFPADEAQKALNEIKERGFLREESYAEARIKAFMHKGYSANYIRQKLNQEKVSVTEETIYEIFEEYRITEKDQIERLIQKKLRSIPEDKEEAYKERQKAIRFAISKGHNPGAVFQMLKNKFSGIQIENDSFIEE